MSLYGYFRNTTPKLLKLEHNGRLYKKLNVFSPHSHTSQSLLQTLSIAPAPDDTLTIFEQIRVSLPKIFHANRIPTYLISNQGESGSFNLASKIIFSNYEKSVFGRESKYRGNLESRSMTYDHDLFKENIDILSKADLSFSPSVIFLHSTAGHGPYLTNIPTSFHAPVDDFFDTLTDRDIFGELTASSKEVINSYDSAIKYIDYSVDEIVSRLDSSSHPSVLIYFSDHGESPYTNRGHDSSRFVHEMIRVPFFIVFNIAAERQLPDLVKKIKIQMQEPHPAVTDQLLATILELWETSIPEGEHQLSYLGKQPTPRFVLTRKAEEQYVVPVFSNNQNIPSHLKNNSDLATKLFNLTYENPNRIICYHRANSIASILRAQLTANCIEVDVVTQNDDILIAHPPKVPGKLSLKDLIKINNMPSGFLWIDAKDISIPKNCLALKAELKNISPPKRPRTLIEFPPSTDPYSPEIAKCAQSLKNLNFRVSFYIPTDLAQTCLSGQEQACAALEKTVNAAATSSLFTDISFDWSIRRLIEKNKLLTSHRWNTWNISIEDFRAQDTSKLHFIIVNTDDDPNRI